MWSVLFLLSLPIPVIMLGCGVFFVRCPGEINALFGYRTARSMRSPETWAFAHACLGRLWRIAGIVSLPLTIIAMLLVFGKSEALAARVVVMLLIGQVVLLVLPILPTERALRKRFDGQGRPRSLDRDGL